MVRGGRRVRVCATCSVAVCRERQDGTDKGRALRVVGGHGGTGPWGNGPNLRLLQRARLVSVR